MMNGMSMSGVPNFHSLKDYDVDMHAGYALRPKRHMHHFEGYRRSGFTALMDGMYKGRINPADGWIS